MGAKGYTQPTTRTYEDTFKFLTWEQFPAILEQSIRFFSVLPQVGVYRHVNDSIKPFKSKLLETTGRDFTLSGIGSLIDYDKYGLNIKRPTPQLSGTGCNGNSLCLEPTCFGFTEGVIENNNMLQSLCWSLNMPCLKDMEYSDAQFSKKIRRYFAMFFQQPQAVLEAYQRTRFLKESIKIVCTDKNFQYTGSLIGGSSGVSLPFYINPDDALSFPDVDAIGAGVGGANLKAFANYLAPRLFSGAFSGGMEDVVIYGLKQDYEVAKEQTASVVDHYMDAQILQALRQNGMGSSVDRIDAMLGEFRHDGLFPTFKLNTNNEFEPVVAEHLEASTIAGFIQTSNPEHSLAKYRALLFVPRNWRFDLVEPPKDNFSDLGLGEGLNFRNNTPGVFPILSSSMFTQNQIGEDGTVIIGQGVSGNEVINIVRGLQNRPQRIAEAVRSEVIMTWSQNECGQTTSGQLPNVGRATEAQSRADGFRLKSTMYIGTDVVGQARPVLMLFQTDTPRSATPIKVCSTVTVDVDNTAGLYIKADGGCAPGGQTYLILTFNKAVGSAFAVNDLAIWRTGSRGDTYLVKVTAVSGNVVSVKSVNSGGSDAATLLPCCEGGPSDDYGSHGELVKTTGATASTSEIMKASYDEGTDSLFLEVFKPLKSALINTDAIITLENGDTIKVYMTAAKPVGVFLQVSADTVESETCDLSTLDCSCLVNASITMD